MGYYSEVQKGNVESSMVLAVPRSVSSALSKALSMSPDFGLYIFQPFYTSDEKTTELDNYIRKAQTDKAATPQDPLKVIMKVMAESVNGQRFQQLMRHSKNICTLLRDPQSQALSAFRAYNELPSGQNMNAAELKKLGEMRNCDTLHEYIVTPWKHMEKDIAQLEKRTRDYGTPNWVVLDGDIMRAAPERTLKQLCQRFGISYSPRMLEGWKQGEDKTVGIAGKNYSRNWLARVQQSSGLKKPTCMTPRLEDFAPRVRQRIEHNLVIYTRALAHEETLAPTSQELRHMIDSEGFHHTCPVACYAMAATGLQSSAALRMQTLRKIRDEEPAYASSYAIIDKTLGVFVGSGASPVAARYASARR
ncbi:MAG: hypothetical protein EBV03_04115 [Proteobacteria bacterium]|nr:hypothetical protein [Pseudomonadota bacterium]